MRPAGWLCLFLLFLMGGGSTLAQGQSISGKVLDPQGNAVANSLVSLVAEDGKQLQTTAESDGQFAFKGLSPGKYALKLNVPGFELVNLPVVAGGEPMIVDIRLKLAVAKQEIRVLADVLDVDILTPDPAQRLLIRQETLDANPGRPGAPVSLPGLPIETASGGIKAPQYFAPGVAGDHGERIASYIQVGTYLVSNNLSANAHGNGYADPNVLVPPVIESVQVDGGAFNVREGNHSQNLSATYGLRSRLEPFVTLTGDYQDVDLVSGWSPKGDAHSWIAVQASYGNGFLDRLEHRQQYKVNGFREFQFGKHALTLFGIGYYGFSFIPGLVPIAVPNLRDTIDPRQKDQTHTGLIALDDIWNVSGSQQIQLSGVFRTYNLTLYSNFGDGLIRQSEFRTVTGGNATYSNKLGDYLTLLAGVDYQRDAPRRDDLDHYASTDPGVYGPFTRVATSNITIQDAAPYLAVESRPTTYFRYYLGFRRDEINFSNDDLLVPTHSFQKWLGVNNPKATVSFLPKEQHSWLPNVSLSASEAFFTNDPRIGTGTTEGSLVSRSHSYQLVASKTLGGTDFRLTLGHVTTEASLAKIDPDTGLQFNEGPGRLRYFTLGARHYFGFGMLQASYSQADARDFSDGTPTPEAPRLIVDALATFERLPFHLRARTEFEYVGAKPLGDGFSGLPNTEVRGAVLRSFRQGRMDVGLNFLIAKGYTGQTTEVLALAEESAPFERIVGVRLPSYVSVSYTYHFQPRQRQ